MKRIDRLLRKMWQFADNILASIYSNNDDGFLEALGVDPRDYEVTLPSGEVVYDDMKALNDTCSMLWDC